MLRHLLLLIFTLHCMEGVPLAQPKEEAKAHQMESLFEDDMNKRSKEVIMFGNQQNKGKSTQAGMIDSDLVPQDSNESDGDDKNEREGDHKNNEKHQSNDDHSKSDESDESFASISRLLPALPGHPSKTDVADILPDVIDAYKAEEDWENYKNTPYDYYRDLVFRKKRSMDRRHAMKKRNYVAAREHLLKHRSEKRSRFRRDLNLNDEELMELINMLKEEHYPYDRKRRQFYRPDPNENDDDDDDEDNRDRFNSEELSRMLAGNARQEFYNPFYYSKDENMIAPSSNLFHYNNDNDDSGESDEDDNDDDNDDEDDDWKHMGPARPIDIQRRSEFFYPPMDYRFMMVPGQKRRLPMHEDEPEGFWGSFDDKRAVKKKRGYYFGDEDGDNDDDDDKESDEEKLNQILELASYMNSHKRNYRSIR